MRRSRGPSGRARSHDQVRVLTVPSLAQPGGAERTVLIKVRYGDPGPDAVRRHRALGPGRARRGHGTRPAPLHHDPRPRALRPLVEAGRAAGRHPLPRPQRRGPARLPGRRRAGRLGHGVDAQVRSTTSRIPVVCVAHSSLACGVPLTGITHLVAGLAEEPRALHLVPGVRRPAHGGHPQRRRGRPGLPAPGPRLAAGAVGRGCRRQGPALPGPARGRQEPLGRHPGAGQAAAQLPADHGRQPVVQPRHPASPDPGGDRRAGHRRTASRSCRRSAASGTCWPGPTACSTSRSARPTAWWSRRHSWPGCRWCTRRVGSIPEMEAEFGPVGWAVNLRPDDPRVDPDEAAGQIMAATDGTGRTITDKMRAAAWARWTGAGHVRPLGGLPGEVVASWE